MGYRKNAAGVVAALIFTAGVLSGCYGVVVHPPHGRGVVVADVPPPIAKKPRLVFLDEYGIYIAPDLEVDLFLYEGVWFYFHGGRWYRAESYRGPWVIVQTGHLPPGLTKVPPGQLKKHHRAANPRGHPGKSRGHR